MRVLQYVPLVDASGTYGGPLSVSLDHIRILNSFGIEAQLCGGVLIHPSVTTPEVAAAFRSRAFRNNLGTLWSTGLAAWLVMNLRFYSVVHIHAARDPTTIFLLCVCILFRKPYLVQTHGMIVPKQGWIHLLDAILVRPLLRQAACHFYLNAVERRRLLSYGVPESLLVELPNGIETQETVTARPLRAARVLFAGRLHPRKRIDLFLGGLLEAGARHPGLEGLVIGPDAGELATLRGYESLLVKCDRKFSYLGPKSRLETRKALAEACVFVLPSDDEPFPMVLLEALAAGTPSVITRGCHISEELEAAEAVVVVDSSASAIATAIADLVENDALWSRVSANAHSLAEDNLSLNRVAKILAASYAKHATASVTEAVPDAPEAASEDIGEDSGDSD